MQTNRRILVFSLYSLPILAIMTAVLSTTAWLLESVRDSLGAAVVRGFAAAAVLLLIVDIIVLVGVLGIRAVEADRDDIEPPN